MSIRLKSTGLRRPFLTPYREAKRAGMWTGDFRKLSKSKQKEIWDWCRARCSNTRS